MIVIPGKNVKTKFTNPYDYGPIVQFIGPRKGNHTVYSDRLYMWDSEKHDSLCTKHFGNTGQYWSDRQPKLIEAFLRDYLDKPSLVLTRVEEHCNVSSGYPVWRLDYWAEGE